MYELRIQFDNSGKVVFQKLRKCNKYFYGVKGTNEMVSKDWLVENIGSFGNVKVSENKLIPHNVVPKINLEEWLKYYNYVYGLLYDGVYDFNYGSKEYNDAIDNGEALIKKYPAFAREIIIYRGDIFSSDRELVALVESLRGMEC